ncbi:MAG: hypothetical protein H6714_05890 [Myxococcales bacterium]|nr:hypothetical protein [Myxococcales bacterium]
MKPTSRFILLTLTLLSFGWAPRARAQENDAQAVAEAHKRAREAKQPASAVPREPGRHTYDMPALPPEYSAHATVYPSHETERIGSYRQPRWTAFRRFPNTRAYVRPAGTMAFEYWLESKYNLKDSEEVRHRSQFEFEFGLGNRLQFDVYLQTQQLGHDGALELHAEKLELRYALANWGVIPLNPTLYAEVVRQHDAPVKLEGKILLAEQFTSRLFFASNIIYERELGDDQEAEYAITGALAMSLFDSRFSAGLELKLETVDVAGARLAFDNYEVLGGPTLFWSPVDPMRVLATFLFGAEVEGDTTIPLFEPTLIVGWEI